MTILRLIERETGNIVQSQIIADRGAATRLGVEVSHDPTFHALSERAQRRIRTLAAEVSS